jgi:hypothetical protein
VERAMDIEVMTHPCRTRTISKYVLLTLSSRIVPGFHLALLGTAGILSLAWFIWGRRPHSPQTALPEAAVIESFLLSAAFIAVYYTISVTQARFDEVKKRDWPEGD